MKITCPYCTGKIELEAVLKDTIMVQVIKMLPDFGAHGRLAWEYAELFGISPPLNARKLHRILSEVLEFFKGGGFVFQQKKYEISRNGLAAAIRTVCNAQLKSPITGHNYLKRVMIDISEKEREGRLKDDERKLRDRESDAQNRPGGELGRWSVKNLPGKVGDLLEKMDGKQAEDDR
jgi:hypothetical protein